MKNLLLILSCILLMGCDISSDKIKGHPDEVILFWCSLLNNGVTCGTQTRDGNLYYWDVEKVK